MGQTERLAASMDSMGVGRHPDRNDGLAQRRLMEAWWLCRVELCRDSRVGSMGLWLDFSEEPILA